MYQKITEEVLKEGKTGMGKWTLEASQYMFTWLVTDKVQVTKSNRMNYIRREKQGWEGGH
jgi:hypothetical protein